MRKNRKTYRESVFDAGEKVKISSEGSVAVPLKFDGEQEVLVVKTGSGYSIIPVLPDIKKVYVEITTKCNFSCITCIRNSWDGDELGEMGWDTFERLLHSFKELPFLEVVHFGGFGEPLSHPKFLEMVKAVKNLGFKAEVITNGSLLSEDIIKELVNMNLDVVYVSLDGPDEVEYNKIRQGADFNTVLDNIMRLNKIKNDIGAVKPDLCFEFVAMKRNFKKLPMLIRLGWNLKVHKIIITNVLPYHEMLREEILYDMDDTGALFGKESAESLLLSIQAQVPYMKLRTDRYCKFIEDNSLCVNFRGDVSPCYPLMHPYRCYIYDREKEMFPYYPGNVKNKTLKEIWTEKKYFNFRQAVKKFQFPSCTDCKYLEGCSYAENNEMDCWGNSPSCADCLWSRKIIACP